MVYNDKDTQTNKRWEECHKCIAASSLHSQSDHLQFFVLLLGLESSSHTSDHNFLSRELQPVYWNSLDPRLNDLPLTSISKR
jgi:hypothetical protein